MYAAFENKNYFSCKITDSLISEYDVSIDGVSTDNTFKGVYWEAAVYFDHNDFTLNVFAERADGVKEIELLKFPIKEINEVRIFEVTYGTTVRTDFKIASIAGAAIGILVLLVMLLHPEPGYTDIGSILSLTLFLGIGITIVFLGFLFFFYPSKKNICINLITKDKRVITLFTEIEHKEWVIEILSKYFSEVKNRGFPFWEINLN
ncbi:MAG: hypothetical protein WBQ32_14745 [Ignavibacteriaceae bacterium]